MKRHPPRQLLEIIHPVYDLVGSYVCPTGNKLYKLTLLDFFALHFRVSDKEAPLSIESSPFPAPGLECQQDNGLKGDRVYKGLPHNALG